MSEFRIYLTNLGKYNEGHLIGEWVDLPINKDELKEVLKRIGINEEYEEYFITDYENDIDYKVEEYQSLEELNEIAEQVINLEDYELEILQAISEVSYLDIKDNLKILESKDYIYYSDCHNDYDLGYEVANESGMLSGVPETVKHYFDYESFGRDLGCDGYHQTTNGYVYLY